MTSRDIVNEYKRVMDSFEMPDTLKAGLVSKTMSVMERCERENKNITAVLAVTGAVALAAGVGTFKLFNKVFGD
ncbi:MAG: hypothetical protein K6F64_00635 [Clostridia bacterium]|nr:hypothetical protein [Clostridia bacterium]